MFNSKPKYKIGDIIIITKTNRQDFFKKGEIGKIRYLEKTIFDRWIYAIEFKEYNKLRHDLKGIVKKGHGFLVMPEFFKLKK